MVELSKGEITEWNQFENMCNPFYKNIAQLKLCRKYCI